MTADAVIAQAQAAIAEGSKSFAAAARVFDRETRASVVMLYAWCRHCDDVIDGQILGRGRRAGEAFGPAQRLEGLIDATARAIRGEGATDAAFAGLGHVVRRHRIPERYPLEHLDGFRMDAEGRSYRTFEETLAYCYGVAGVVGVMMAMVMGVRDDPILDRACDLGIAFQLTNIARDVVEDAAVGRVYLPQAWLSEAGIAPHNLAAPEHRAALAGVAARLVEAAQPYYGSAGVGLRALPIRSAWAVAAALGIYREIGLEVRSRGPAAWNRRVATSKARKLRHLLAGGLVACRARSLDRFTSQPPRGRLWVRPREAIASA